MFSLKRFQQVPVMGIVRGLDWEELSSILPAFAEAGLNTLEITLNTIDAPQLIRRVQAVSGDRIQVGAGTVRTMQDLAVALDAGASFIVTPILDLEVVGACTKESIPVFPGAFTPTEIHQAHQAGATMVKVFPASAMGPDYIRNLKAPMPDILLMPTGGIDLGVLPRFKAAGADAYGIGSPLFPKELLARRDEAAWLAHFSSFASSSRHTS